MHSKIFYLDFSRKNIFEQKCIIIPLGCTLCHGTPYIVIYTPNPFLNGLVDISPNGANILTTKDTPNPYFLMTEILMTEAPPSNNSKDCEGNLPYTSIRVLLILYVILSYPYF